MLVRLWQEVQEVPRRLVVLHFNPPNIDKLVCADSNELSGKFDDAKAAVAPGGSVWICWPKKSSGVDSDLGQAEVRRHAMERGLVDSKVAAIDQTWSGLRFGRKKPK